MIKKVTIPIIEEIDGYAVPIVVGTKVEYRIFGILLYRKTFFLPVRYGVNNWDDYQIRI